jgi:CRP/FNR family transcriptional regulator, cyclic AMP receptor protein
VFDDCVLQLELLLQKTSMIRLRRTSWELGMAQAQAGQIGAILAQHDFFRGLPESLIRRLASRAHQAQYTQGSRIFSKGEEGQGLLAVLSGVVKISAVSEDGKEIVLNLIGQSEIFGEIALLDGGARTADATALTDCQLLLLDRRDVLPLLREDSSVAIRLLEVVSSRLRRTSEQVEDLSFGDLSVRLAKALLRLAELQNTLRADRPRVSITQKELAHAIGLSRERTNWYLRAWERAGYIQLEKGGCIINNKDQLRGLARVGTFSDD